MIDVARIAPLLRSARTAPPPNAALMARLLRTTAARPAARGVHVANAGQFGAGADLPTSDGGPIEPGILPGAELPNDFFGGTNTGGVTVTGDGPRMGGNLPPGYGYQDQDAEDAVSANVYGDGPDFGDGQAFNSVSLGGGGFGPFSNYNGAPSLYDTTWTWQPDLNEGAGAWVPAARTQSGSGSFAGGGSGPSSAYGGPSGIFATNAGPGSTIGTLFPAGWFSQGDKPAPEPLRKVGVKTYKKS